METKAELKKYYFYLLQCADQTFYGGFTTDVEKRVATHNEGKGAKYTRFRLPVKLLYFEEFDDKSEALKREYWFKHQTRTYKENFLHEQKIPFKKLH